LLGLLRNRNFLLVLAITLGLFFGKGAQETGKMIIPALAVIMTLSVMGIPDQLFRSPRAFWSPVFSGLAIHYGVLSGLLFLLNNLLIRDPALKIGFVLVLAVPPAVAVIPFTMILKGDLIFSLMATIGCYLAALVIMPIITLGLIGSGFINRQKLFLIMIELIIIPLLLSRFLKWRNYSGTIEPYKGTIINWGFFLVTYTVVGMNRNIFLSHPAMILPVMIVALAGTFLLGGVIEKIGGKIGMDPQKLTSLILLGTQKNTGLAAGLALTLFDDRTALPATVCTIVMIIHFVWLNLRGKAFCGPERLLEEVGEVKEWRMRKDMYLSTVNYGRPSARSR
jgi:bile acid:Na+ symporter, BASS family